VPLLPLASDMRSQKYLDPTRHLRPFPHSVPGRPRLLGIPQHVDLYRFAPELLR